MGECCKWEYHYAIIVGTFLNVKSSEYNVVAEKELKFWFEKERSCENNYWESTFAAEIDE